MRRNPSSARALGILIFGALCVFDGCPLRAGRTFFSGGGEGFWKTRSVIVGRISRVEIRENGPYLKVDVLRTVSIPEPIGATLELYYDAGRMSELTTLPEVSEVLLLLIEKNEKGGWMVPGYALSFFPSNCAVMKVKGADDPSVSEMDERIKKMKVTAAEQARVKAIEDEKRRQEWKKVHDEENKRGEKKLREMYDAAFKRDQKLREEAEKKKADKEKAEKAVP